MFANLMPHSHLLGLTALGFMALEFGLGRLARHDSHDLRESATTFAVVLLQPLFRLLEAGIVALPFALAYDHRLFTLDATTAPGLAGLFFGTEILYYWYHRAAHRSGWLWAHHSVHHSPTRMNLTAAVRLGWTGALSGSFLFFLPLALIGYPPYAIVSMLGLNLGWQFFIHTEFAPRLGPLERVLNTPAHHRVHHASNPDCLDRNYGGILIVWDRLFGTFAEAPKDETLRYGLVGVAPSLNPLRVALGGWLRLWRQARRAGSPARALRILFGPPGPDLRLPKTAEPPAFPQPPQTR